VLQEFAGNPLPECVAEVLRGESGLVLLHSKARGGQKGRFSFVAARPFLTFRAKGSHCELESGQEIRRLYGNPWLVLEELLARYEVRTELDVPFPMGGAFGYCGYELGRFAQRRSWHRAVDDLELPDCQFRFYGSLAAFDHQLGKTWIIATGASLDGARQNALAAEHMEFWSDCLEQAEAAEPSPLPLGTSSALVESNLRRAEFIRKIQRAQEYIRVGDVYQVNLSQRFTSSLSVRPWELFQRLSEASPAPLAAYVDGGHFQLASASPELFLRLSGRRILTRPIKGTRRRSPDPDEDARLAYELQTSPKELAELLMITDLLRNDLGQVSEYGSVIVPELSRLESFAQVHHLVSTVEGRLRPELSHVRALAACFPGGSITGAPKIRAMEIIDELEPVTRGPYTGALGYFGFNHESQFSMIIRTAIMTNGLAYFQSGAGIVADSVPEAEYDETLIKAAGFFRAVQAGKSLHSDASPV
jgi:para-aminobenzoate synthetase component 1